MAIVLMAILSAAGVWPCVLVWRDAWIRGTRASDAMEVGLTAMSTNPRSRRAMVRTMVSTEGFLVCLTVSLWLFELCGDLVALHAPLLLLMLFFALAHLSIVLFNRPRFLVPPHLRQDRGRWTRR
ncbi:hypothetical protein ACFC1B_09485 [Streptomyces xiamenensis]|uniref:hypothetical protein n=1 Tax=Streptomyces xiamenensis TaxID=408015 RepID=UPI0035DE2C40